MALGNILRARKNVRRMRARSTARRSRTIAKPEKPNWLIFYFRGICYERAKQWDKAEADLKKALELFPEQPHVLNYLGYSWVDQGMNLDEGMKMIRRAVEQRPDDGYIVDSLGWAYYRLGNYEEAVKHLERAVELKPEDPTINDHLGDAYWKVGRNLEARFQWSHARDLKPEPDELKKIEEKLKSGLPDETPRRRPRAARRPATAASRGRCRGLRVSTALVEFAPAKVNLTLRVLGRRADGYHELDSLVAFADVGDRLTLRARRARSALDVRGPTRRRRRAGRDNLVLKAARALAERVRGLTARAASRWTSTCRSRPASAADRRMRRRRCACWRAPTAWRSDDPRIAAAARRDRRRCAGLPRSARARDARHRRTPVGAARSAAAAGRAGQSAACRADARRVRRFARADHRGKRRRDAVLPMARRADRFHRKRTPTISSAGDRLQPVIGDVLAALRALPGCRLARMSGSGATCFGLFAHRRRRMRAQTSARRNPRWWMTRTILRLVRSVHYA